MSNLEEQLGWSDTLQVVDPPPDEGTPDATEPEDTVLQGRPRNPDGTFAPTATAETVEAPAADDPVAKFVSKYGGDERKALEAAVELQSLQGRTSNELGQLRQLVEQLSANQNVVPEPAWEPNESLVYENPILLAEQSYRAGDEQTMWKAVNAANEMSPGAGSVWLENKQLATRLAEIEAQTKKLAEPIQAQQHTQLLAQAYSELEQQYPDFDSLRTEMAQVAAEYAATGKGSFVDKNLKSDNPDEVRDALEYLYLKAKPRHADTVAIQGQEAAQQNSLAALQARQDASVLTGQAQPNESPQSASDKIWAGWEKHRVMNEGWPL